MWYDFNYSCGHSGSINVVGPTKDRQYWVDREASKLCPECYEKQQLADLEETKAKWAERGLPELTGTTKQILKADDVRDRAIEMSREKLERTQRRAEKEPDRVDSGFAEFSQHFEECLAIALKEIPSAYVWLNDTIQLYKKAQTVWETQKADILDTNNEFRIAEPDEKKTDSVAEIIPYTADDGAKYVKVLSPKDSKIINVLKAATYYWSSHYSCWMNHITEQDTSPEDAQAYIVAKLLEAGITVKARANIISMVFSGEYAPKQLRFIFYNGAIDKFGIEFPYGDDCTGNVRNMGARWDRERSWYSLSGNDFRKIEDLVNLYGFGLSSKARDHIEELSGIVIPVTPNKANEQVKGAGIKAVLESSREIIEDLKDD